jgi:hypothetical protein
VLQSRATVFKLELDEHENVHAMDDPQKVADGDDRPGVGDRRSGV